MKTFTKILFATTALAVAGGATGTTAYAQSAPGTAGTSAPLVEGPGIKVGEGTVIHPTVGLDLGATTNVFFTETESQPAGLLRLLVEGVVGSLSNQRRATSSADAAKMEEEQAAAVAARGAVEYRASLGLLYTEFLSGQANVRSQRDVGVRARLTGTIFPQRTWQIGFDNFFQRLVRPPNFESRGDVDRDINVLRVALKYAPKGRSISGHIRYENTIDVFENDAQGFADRFQNNVGVNAAWQFLPVTKFYADASIGVFTGLGAQSTKVTSFPLRVIAGAQSAITTTLTASLHLGYGQGFYTAGPDFQNVLVGGAVGYRYSPLGRVSLLYDYTFADSINANFFRDHTVRASIGHNFVPFAVEASAEMRLRRYEGVLAAVASPMMSTRDDVLFGITAGVNYNFRDWLAATVDYQFSTVQTDFRYQADPGPPPLILDPSFIRHQLVAGVRAAL